MVRGELYTNLESTEIITVLISHMQEPSIVHFNDMEDDREGE